MAKPKAINPLQKNEQVEITITGMTAEGLGVGRHNGVPIFVPLTDIGDEITARVVKVLPRYAYGRIEKLTALSADRIPVDCPVFSTCGGCCYRHITYEKECLHKQNKVKDAITRIAKLDPVLIKPIVKCDSRNGYRNKALIPVSTGKSGELEAGFYALNSHRVINTNECFLHPPVFSQILEIFRKWQSIYSVSIYDEILHQGILRRLYLRHGENLNEIMVCIVINGQDLPHSDALCEMLLSQVKEIKSIIINLNEIQTNVALGAQCKTLWGKNSIRDTICNVTFELSPLSFYQVNRRQAERLYQQTAIYAGLTGKETVLDLYCGTGTIGLTLAKATAHVIGVETEPAAIEDARVNAKVNGIKNAEFHCMDAAEAAKKLQARNIFPDVLILDPPRKGCSKPLLDTIRFTLSPKRIVYISCDPATLARDLTHLTAEKLYTVHEIIPYDLFPATAHVECIALLTNSK